MHVIIIGIHTGANRDPHRGDIGQYMVWSKHMHICKHLSLSMLCLLGFKHSSCLLYSKVNVVHLWGPMEIDGFSAPTAESGGNASMRMASNIYVMLVLKDHCAIPATIEDSRHIFASTAAYFQG